MNIIEHNNFATVCPELVREWNTEKNKDLLPTMFKAGSGKKVWWKCEQGHEWETTINHRIKGSGCPYCSGKLAIAGENDLATTHPELVKEWNTEKNKGLLPTMVKAGSGKKVWWKCEQGHEWEATISNRIKGSGCPYCSGKLVIAGETDLATKYPELVEEWNTEKNKGLLPTMIKAGSGKKVWWKCGQGHEWEATINNRVKERGCPYCSGKLAIAGENDLATTHSKLAKEWNTKKNKGLLPTMVKAGSNKKVWWKCEQGHEWEAAICDRVNNRGCPYCSGRRAIEGETDLATTHPELAKEWNTEKNKGLLPTMVKAGSGKKVWWKCEQGHEWEATTGSRIEGKGCPYCSGKMAIAGKNDLATTHPELAKEWNTEKNKGLLPTMVKAGSGKKVWWKCEQGHEWEATIGSRKSSGCPYCSGRITIAGENDLATTYPELVKEWNTEKNKGLLPTMFKAGSGKKVWWKCEQGHEWQTRICNRIIKGIGCPYCSGQMAIAGENDLATTHPELVKEWNTERNKGLLPMMVKEGSDKKVWWKCKWGHEWRAKINNRVNGTDCPYCSGKLAIAGENDLATIHPDLAKEWHPTKNKNKQPHVFLPHSGKKVWWLCEKGHEWKDYIVNRTYGRGCPYCSGRKIYYKRK